jgi:uncharacterized protein YegP (UPF0339 family)
MEVLYQLSYPGSQAILEKLPSDGDANVCSLPRDRRDEMAQFDAYEDLVGKWRWRLVAGDGRVVASSGESYDSHWHALRAAEDVRGVAAAARISSAPADGVGDALGAIIERELAQGL